MSGEIMRFDNAVFETSFGTKQQLKSSDLPEIAFSGRSNVGKSSLLNKVLGRKALARVSSVPGKTVTINFFRVDQCRFVDLPGYGYAKVSHSEKQRWAELMESYFQSGRDLRLVVQLLDMRHEMTQMDADMLRFLSESGIPFAVALTKCDKLNKTEFASMLEQHQRAVEEFGSAAVIPFSATKGTGVETLRACIEQHLNTR